MSNTTRGAGLIAGIALIAAAGCARKSTTNAMDDGLRSDLQLAGASDLELAPKAGRQVVVSAIEGGPQASPAPAPHRAPAPVQRRQRAEARAPQRVEAAAPAPAAQPVAAPTPAPQPQQRQPGVYSTEADVFRQMPWIRP